MLLNPNKFYINDEFGTIIKIPIIVIYGGSWLFSYSAHFALAPSVSFP